MDLPRVGRLPLPATLPLDESGPQSFSLRWDGESEGHATMARGRRRGTSASERTSRQLALPRVAMQSPTSLPSPIKTRWIRATIVLASQGCRECGGWTRLERGPRGGDAVGECHVRGRARVSTDGPASNWAPSIPATWLPDESSVVGADGTTRGRLPVPRQSAVARDGRPRVEHLPIPAIVATRRIRATIILPCSNAARCWAGSR